MKKYILFHLAALLAISVFWTAPAHAEAPVQTKIYRTNTVVDTDDPSYVNSCKKYASWLQARGNNQIYQSATETLCTTKRASDGFVSSSPISSFMAPWCADGSRPVNGVCPDRCPKDGTAGPDLEWIIGWKTGPASNAPYASGPVRPPYKICRSSCEMYTAVKSDHIDGSASANGYYKAWAALGTSHNGVVCTTETDTTGAPAPTSPPPETNRCPRGTVAIGIDEDGTTICRGTQEPDNTPPPQETTTSPPVTNPDGSTTQTETTTRQNADGSTTTTTRTTITNPDGSRSTTETSQTGNRPDGTAGRADPEQTDLCRQHPDLNICKNSQVSGGDCNTPLSCEGDAIQCAIARQVAEANCRRKAEVDELNDSAVKRLGDQLLNGNDPLNAQLPTPGNAQNIEFSGLNSNGFLTGGSTCLNDKPFTANGMQFVIPFSAVCEHLSPLRYAMLIIGALASLAILRTSVLG